jgi:hypothetical protein
MLFFLPKSKNLRMKTKLFLFFSYLKNEETINFSIKQFSNFLGWGEKSKKTKIKKKNKLQASKFKAIRLCDWRVPGPKMFFKILVVSLHKMNSKKEIFWTQRRLSAKKYLNNNLNKLRGRVTGNQLDDMNIVTHEKMQKLELSRGR